MSDNIDESAREAFWAALSPLERRMILCVLGKPNAEPEKLLGDMVEETIVEIPQSATTEELRPLLLSFAHKVFDLGTNNS